MFDELSQGNNGFGRKVFLTGRQRPRSCRGGGEHPTQILIKNWVGRPNVKEIVFVCVYYTYMVFHTFLTPYFETLHTLHSDTLHTLKDWHCGIRIAYT